MQNGLLSPFTLALSVSFTSGVVLASPVWLYQLWGFVAPGLHKNEKKYSLRHRCRGFPAVPDGHVLRLLVAAEDERK